MRWPALLAVAFVAAGAVPAGSAPDGLTWTANGPDGGGATYIEIDPRTPSTLYAGTTMAGVFRSTNGGRTWDRRSNGLPPNAGVGPFELAPSDPSRLYAVVGGNTLFTTTDAGATWRPLARLENYINRLVVDPSQPRTIYGTSDRSLIKSTDGGQTWSQPILSSDGPIAIAPSAPNVLYAEVYGRLRRSADGGATWTEMTGSFSSIDLIMVDPRNADVVYFISSRDLWKSTSGGSSPSKIRTGWPPAPGIETFAVDPRTPSTIYAGTSNDGVFRSRDGGATWEHAASGLAELAYPEVRQRIYEGIRDLEVSPAAGSPVYLTHAYRGVYKTDNEGRRWHESNDGLDGDQDLVAGGRPSCTVGRVCRDVQRRRVALRGQRPALVAPRAHRTLHFRRHRRPGEEARRVGRDKHRSLPQRQRRPNLEAAAQAQGSQRERRRDRAVEPPVRLRGDVRPRPLPLMERRPDVEPARSPTDRHGDRDRRPSPPAPDTLGRSERPRAAFARRRRHLSRAPEAVSDGESARGRSEEPAAAVHGSRELGHLAQPGRRRELDGDERTPALPMPRSAWPSTRGTPGCSTRAVGTETAARVASTDQSTAHAHGRTSPPA